MKKSIIYLFILFLAFSACKKEKYDGFVIKGKIDNLDVQSLKLKNYFTGDIKNIEVKKGKFKFKGKVEEPTKFFLKIPRKDEGEPNNISFFVENTDIVISGTGNDLKKWDITGGATQEEYAKLKAEKKKLYKEYNYKAIKEKYLQAKETKNDKLIEKLLPKLDKFHEKKMDFLVSYIKENPNSYVAANLMPHVTNYLDPMKLEKLVNKLSPSLKNYKPIKEVIKTIEKKKLVMVGKTMPDFTMNDVNGKPIKLSDVYSKSKYTLVDFWASWCGPCRKENPTLVKAYKKYKWRGFTILGVSLDMDKGKWQKAIKKDKLTWKNVSDLKGWKNEIAAKFGIEGIPTNFLLNKKGEIVATNLMEQDLEKKLKKLLPYRRR